MATTQIFYSDIPTNFTIHPVKEDLVLLYNEDAVKRSIRSLLLTDPYERFFNPGLGSDLDNILFIMSSIIINGVKSLTLLCQRVWHHQSEFEFLEL